jgi:hypothetical protein
LGDTQHGGDQTVTMSALIGANTADDRGNVMIGIERDTREKAYAWQRDWRIADYANPAAAGGGFAFGSATWWHNEPVANTRPNPNFNPAGPTSGPNAAFNARRPGRRAARTPPSMRGSFRTITRRIRITIRPCRSRLPIRRLS